MTIAYRTIYLWDSYRTIYLWDSRISRLLLFLVLSNSWLPENLHRGPLQVQWNMLKLKSEEYSAGQIKQEAQVTVIIQVTVLKLTFTPFSTVYFYKNKTLFYGFYYHLS